MKQLLLLTAFLGFLGTSIAQSTLTVEGQLLNTSGDPIDLTIYLEDNGNVLTESTTCDASGNYSVTFTLSGAIGQGSIEITFDDCNNIPQTINASYNSGSTTVDIGTEYYCQTTNCESDFTVSQQMVGNDPVTGGYEFTSTSTGSGLTYAWDFGDGTTATAATASHEYSSSGTYIVCLTVDDGNGCTDTNCETVIVDNMAAGLENVSIDDLSISPNPASESLQVNLTILTPSASIELITTSGKLIEKQTFKSGKQQTSFNVATLEKGTYLLRVNSGNSTIVEKVSVQ